MNAFIIRYCIFYQTLLLNKPISFLKPFRFVPLVSALLLLVNIVFAQKSINSIKPGIFHGIPRAIEDSYCVGLFIYDSLPLPSKNYVFVTNIEKVALIKIDGKNLRLALIQKTDLPKKSFKRVFKGSGYQAVLLTKDISKKDEQGIESGSLEITHEKEKIILKVHGEVSCN